MFIVTDANTVLTGVQQGIKRGRKSANFHAYCEVQPDEGDDDTEVLSEEEGELLEVQPDEGDDDTEVLSSEKQRARDTEIQMQMFRMACNLGQTFTPRT
jgi:predicted nucleic acid-binding Zn ribbon protein